jgi:hypothetical protein
MENLRSLTGDYGGYLGKLNVPRGTLAATNLRNRDNRLSANGDNWGDLGEPNAPRGTLGGAKLGKAKRPSVTQRRNEAQPPLDRCAKRVFDSSSRSRVTSGELACPKSHDFGDLV